MATTNNPLEEILRSDVDDSAFSALVGSLDGQIASSIGRDTHTTVLPSADRSNHLFGVPITIGRTNGSESPNYTSLPSTGTQSAVLANHTASVEATGQTTAAKGVNNGVTIPPSVTFTSATNVSVFNNAASASRVINSPMSSSSKQPPSAVVVNKSFTPNQQQQQPQQQMVVVTIANPSSSSLSSSSSSSSSSASGLAPSFTQFLNVAKFNNSVAPPVNVLSTGVVVATSDHKRVATADQRTLVVTNLPTTMTAAMRPVQSHTSAGPIQVITQLQPTAQVVTTTNIRSFPGQQLQAQQQNLAVIQSSVPTQVMGFQSPQQVQIVGMPTQNVVARTPVMNLRTLAPRITSSQPVVGQPAGTLRLPQAQSQQGLSAIRPQGVMGPISFPSGIGTNVQLPPGVVLVKNERGQMMLFQSPPQQQQQQQQQQQVQQLQTTLSNSQVIQSLVQQPSQNVRPSVAGQQINMVQAGQVGQGLIAVSSGGQTRFIQPQQLSAVPVRIPTSAQGVLQMMQPASGMNSQQQQQQATSLRSSSSSSSALTTPSIVSRLVQSNAMTPMTVAPTTSSMAAVNVNSVTIKDVQDNVRKCKNFLSTLLKLAAGQPPETVKNVKTLIQGLVDGTVEPEAFTNQLQKELKSSPQPYLVPFLKKSLPFLRQSLTLNRMTIDGIRAPPTSAAAAGGSSIVMQQQHRHHSTASVTIPILSNIVGTPAAPPGAASRPAFPAAVTNKPSVPQMTHPPHPHQHHQQQMQLARLALLQQNMRMTGAKQQQQQHQHPNAAAAYPANLLVRPGVVPSSGSIAASQTIVTTNVTSNGLIPSMTGAAVAAATMHKGEKRKYDAMRDDDDINDVATMGGVNLSEESRNILASNSDLISGQLRSCKDEKFLDTQLLTQRINSIAQKHRIDGLPPEVAHLVSIVTQERLRTILERLSVYTDHRLENYRNDQRFESISDAKSQVKFLEELDSIERKKKEDTERGILLRAAKSRTKLEDPEQAKLKEKAKAMQLADMEQLRYREANLTALAAIGPRKPRISQSASAAADVSSGTNSNKNTAPSRPRIKRVNLRDLLFLMEQDRDSRRSTMLYKAFLK